MILNDFEFSIEKLASKNPLFKKLMDDCGGFNSLPKRLRLQALKLMNYEKIPPYALTGRVYLGHRSNR